MTCLIIGIVFAVLMVLGLIGLIIAIYTPCEEEKGDYEHMTYNDEEQCS